MKLRFPESKIQYWAERYEPQSTETQFVKLKPKVQKRCYLTKTELMRVAHWKSPRPVRHVEKMIPTTYEISRPVHLLPKANAPELAF